MSGVLLLCVGDALSGAEVRDVLKEQLDEAERRLLVEKEEESEEASKEHSLPFRDPYSQEAAEKIRDKLKGEKKKSKILDSQDDIP